MKDNNYIKSPTNYTGSKHKLLPQIIPLFPTDINVFVDLFGGGMNVGINVIANKVLYNDIIPQLVDLFRNFKIRKAEDIHKRILEIIDEYGLSKSYEHGYEHYGCDTSKGLGSHNKVAYHRLRDDYNANPNWDKFYTLICCSFSNQIRFNSKGGFNVAHGKRDYNVALQEKLKIFVDKLHETNISFSSKDFRTLPIDKLTSKDLIYCDPPYLNTTANYNENGGWTQTDENDLLSLLNKVNRKGIRFALSNNLRTNPLLKDWATVNNYNIHYLFADYGNCNYHKKDKTSKDEEVLITNYEIGTGS